MHLIFSDLFCCRLIGSITENKERFRQRIIKFIGIIKQMRYRKEYAALEKNERYAEERLADKREEEDI